MLTLHRLRPGDADWERMDAMHDRIVFQRREWIEFLAATQNAEPVVAVVREADRDVGYFTGLIVKRLGVRILGSPFPGWSTDYMGFNLLAEVSRRGAAEALLPFAFGPLGCHHVELCDRHLRLDDLLDSRYQADCSRRTFVVDLTGEESDVFARMTKEGRQNVREGVKAGVQVEVAHGLSFADEYYTQLQGVFARQSLVPTYDLKRVQELIRHLENSGHLLLVRALTPDGRGIATGIALACNGTAHFWGTASIREKQLKKLRPTEAVYWYAMRWARERGCSTLDLGGGGEYKTRYGARELRVPRFRCSRFPGLAPLRGAAEAAVRARQNLAGRRASMAARLIAGGP